MAMRSRTIISILFLFTAQAFCAQQYYSAISINAAQVPSTQSNFPVLVSQTDNRFKSTGNGGHVASSSGFDIRPYSDSGLTTAITGYWLERYDATTGEVVMWVNVSSLSSSTTPIYLGYGDTSLTTDGSSASGTWSNSFISVYTLKDGTTLSVNDALGTHNGTNHSVTATSGQIDGGGSFVAASSQYVDIGSWSGPTSITIGAWFNATSLPASAAAIIDRRNTNTLYPWSIVLLSTGKLQYYGFTQGVGDIHVDPGSHTQSTATWYLVHFVYSNSAGTGGLTGYVNAASDGTTSRSGSDLRTDACTTYIGNDNFNASRFFNGKIDHVTISSVARTANWITTEYNNQSAPGTFETLGTEVSLVVTNTSGFFGLMP